MHLLFFDSLLSKWTKDRGTSPALEKSLLGSGTETTSRVSG